MQNTSPFLAMQRVEGELKRLVRQIDPDSLELDEKKALGQLRRLSLDTRLDIRDYELSETRLEQISKAVDAKNCLAKLEAAMLSASMVFGPADIAQLSAQLEQINGWLV